jgi:phage tail-like protein
MATDHAATDRAEWMLGSLPAIYAEADRVAGGTLSRLLAALGAVFFEGITSGDGEPGFPGLERQILAIPVLFVPAAGQPQAPDWFLPWLAAWLAFTPHEHLDPMALRRVLSNIVPLYSQRGTRACMVKLLQLAFEETIASVQVDDRPRSGFTVGHSLLGNDTRLARGQPFFFTVTVDLKPGQSWTGAFERRLRAVIDFARPAHTSYELKQS